ncbi:hypothetical protein [Paenibacillus roseipurpureus]|uniref:Uncharacterized protein n=1 Tax=Paenibacillus roseopurpureus TaxID=2918901 RepID=A0AA96LW69_9BACL|nr:hypothetical protein [Paenibacillus sp. MBLB1832]WNR45790.1 hypothetical protein MJB10_06725 [Paenibacillus sp. MBLB1832]
MGIMLLINGKEGIVVLTYYQKTILASLIDYSYRAVEELKEKYDVHLLIRWRRLIKRIETNFELPLFYATYWDMSFKDPLCDKHEEPEVLEDLQRFELLRELIEFSKVLVKTVRMSDNMYDLKYAVFRLVNETLIHQFGLDYRRYCSQNPLPINIHFFLISNGLHQVHLDDKDTIWVFPHNVKENETFYTSGIFVHEAEGLCYLGGERLLSRILDYYRLSMHEVVQFHKKRKSR